MKQPRILLIVVIMLVVVLRVPVLAQQPVPPLPGDLDQGWVLFPQAVTFGSLDAEQVEQVYTFYVEDGDEIVITMQRQDGDVVPYLEVRTQPLITQAANDLAGVRAELRFEAHEDGWLVLAALHDPAAGTAASGTFTLLLQGTPLSVYNLLGLGELPTLREDDRVLLQTREITLSPGTDYYLPARAGEQLTLDPVDGTSLRLYDLEDTRLAQGDEVDGYRVTESGWLRLEARRSNAASAVIDGALTGTPVPTVGGFLSSFITFTPFPTATATPIPTATPTSTSTPVPTATPRPITLAETQIVFTCFVGGIDQLCLMNGDGSNQRQITSYGGTTWYASMTGGQIFYSSRRSGVYEIYTMDVDGSGDRRITTDGDGYAPMLSPDGTRIVFAAQQQNSDQDIYVINLDGTNMRQLTFTPGNQLDPVWSPDGSEILYASDVGGGRELFIMSADGSNQRPITTGGAAGRSDWSPDGRFIAYYAGAQGQEAIYIMNSDGSNLRALTPNDGSKAPSFSPDGNWITFTSRRDGDNEIYIMRADGSEVTQLTFNDRPDYQSRLGR